MVHIQSNRSYSKSKDMESYYDHNNHQDDDGTSCRDAFGRYVRSNCRLETTDDDDDDDDEAWIVT